MHPLACPNPPTASHLPPHAHMRDMWLLQVPEMWKGLDLLLLFLDILVYKLLSTKVLSTRSQFKLMSCFSIFSRAQFTAAETRTVEHLFSRNVKRHPQCNHATAMQPQPQTPRSALPRNPCSIVMHPQCNPVACTLAATQGPCCYSRIKNP